MLTILRGDYLLTTRQLNKYKRFVNKQLSPYGLNIKNVEIMVTILWQPCSISEWITAADTELKRYEFRAVGVWSNDTKAQFILNMHTEDKLKQLLTVRTGDL